MKFCVAMGYIEDQWHSSRLHSQQLAAAVQGRLGSAHTTEYFAPELGRQPRFWDRRLGYRQRLPECDLLHLFDPAYADCLLSGRPSVLNVTDIAFWLHRSWYNALLRQRIVEGAKRASVRVAISRKTDQEMRQVLGFGCEEVVYLGSDPKLFAYNPQARIEGKILHVGSVMPRKEVERNIKLLALLPEPFHFVQVGGQFTPEQRNLISLLNLTDRVTQHPFVPLEDLILHYQQAAVLLFPSSYEGYGVPLIEARLCGTPVVTTTEVPAVEALQDDQGTRVMALESLDESVGTKAAKALAAELRAWLPAPLDIADRSFHSWDRVGLETVAIYEKLLGTKL